MIIDTQAYYGKLARKEQISEDEIVALLKELSHFRKAATYLASCQAATLERLPKSSGKSARGRHVNICHSAELLLAGDSSPIGSIAGYGIADAIERCKTVVEDHKSNQ